MQFEDLIKYKSLFSLDYKLKTYKPINILFLVSYIGTKYYGVQYLSNKKTIEFEILNSICKSFSLNFEDINNFRKKSSFSFLSRTDSQVHAVKNILSFKTYISPSYLLQLEDLRKFLNFNLPYSIKIQEIYNIESSLNFKLVIRNKIYKYLIPIWLFKLMKYLTNIFKFENSNLAKNLTYKQILNIQNMKLDFEKIKKINNNSIDLRDIKKSILNILNNIRGRHNFHNFTKNLIKKSKNFSFRKIEDVKITEIKIFDEFWVEIELTAPSFLTYQIRKIIGFIIINFLLNLDLDLVLKKLFSADIKIGIPKAPGIFLYLRDQNLINFNLDDNQLKFKEFEAKIIDEIYKNQEMFYDWILGIRPIELFNSFVSKALI